MSKTSIAILAIFLIACSGTDKKERPSSPRITKETKLVSPKQSSKYTIGEIIPFEFTSKGAMIDSVLIDGNSELRRFTEANFELSLNSKRVGSTRIKATVFFGGKKETHYAKVIIFPNQPPATYSYEVLNTYSHDPLDYTQGLLVDQGFLYESTGQTGESTLKKKELETGKVLEQYNLTDDFFGEGLALVNNEFYQLTYTSGACFVYNRNLERVNSFNYQGQGWGLTEYMGNLLMTNSTEKIFVRDPKTFTVIDEFEVYDDKGKIDSINELEVIDGMLYANVYQEDIIIVIDPETGIVEQKIDMSGLLTPEEGRDVDVLNGIAYDRKNKRIFVTGKLWPKLFEVKFIPKKSS